MLRLSVTLLFSFALVGCAASRTLDLGAPPFATAHLDVTIMQPGDLPSRSVSVRQDGSVVCSAYPILENSNATFAINLEPLELEKFKKSLALLRRRLAVDPPKDVGSLDSHTWTISFGGASPPQAVCRDAYSVDECGKTFTRLWRLIATAGNACRADELTGRGHGQQKSRHMVYNYSKPIVVGFCYVAPGGIPSSNQL